MKIYRFLITGGAAAAAAADVEGADFLSMAKKLKGGRVGFLFFFFFCFVQSFLDKKLAGQFLEGGFWVVGENVVFPWAKQLVAEHHLQLHGKLNGDPQEPAGLGCKGLDYQQVIAHEDHQRKHRTDEGGAQMGKLSQMLACGGRIEVERSN